MRLRTKFSFFAILILVIALLGMSVILFIFEKKHLLQTMREGQVNTIKGLAEVCKEAIISEDDLLLMNYIKVVKRTTGVIYAMFVDDEGKVVVHTDTNLLGYVYRDSIGIKAQSSEDLLIQSYKGREGGELIDVSLPVLLGEGRLGTARVGFSKVVLNRIVEDTLSLTRRRILVVTGVAFSFGIFGAFILAQLMSRPIRKLTEGAKSIGQGNLEQKILVKSRDELGDLAGEFNRMAKKLKELDQMKDDFVSSVSHELRSPLTSIKGYVDFILRGKAGPLNKKLIEYLTIVKNNTSRLGMFINDILDLAKIEAKRFELGKEALELSPFIEEMVTFFQPQAEEGKIQLETAVPTSISLVSADSDKLRQVFTNLLSNAFKFTPEGGKITIEAKNAGSGSFVEIAIKDTGVGIAEKDVQKVFDKFQQVKSSGSKVKRVKGTGLGLAIVRGIVEAHGGRIWVESELNKGSNFIFTLPKA
ncbi:Adaptive-response sensory-kinase SasA [subsurface metagenome]|nr:HAMP domain-containing protein [Clostridia bacterium]